MLKGEKNTNQDVKATQEEETLIETRAVKHLSPAVDLKNIQELTVVQLYSFKIIIKLLFKVSCLQR